MFAWIPQINHWNFRASEDFSLYLPFVDFAKIFVIVCVCNLNIIFDLLEFVLIMKLWISLSSFGHWGGTIGVLQIRNSELHNKSLR